MKTLQARTSSDDSDALEAFTDSVVNKNMGSFTQKASTATSDNASIAQANTTSNVTANATTTEPSPDADSNV